jgi:hypothetical protein
MQYRQIEIDVEVNRWLEGKRISFDQTHNDILRAEAGLPSHSPRSATAASLTSNGDSGGAWTAKGATLPEGTRLRMSYNGNAFNGTVESGSWLVNGARYSSPSAAASALSGVSLNGWNYWEAQLPGADRWQSISKFRSEIARRRRK